MIDFCVVVGLSCEYICDNFMGIFVCVCFSGFELEFNGENCIGIYISIIGKKVIFRYYIFFK